MPKRDPLSAVKSPLNSKLSAEISRPTDVSLAPSGLGPNLEAQFGSDVATSVAEGRDAADLAELLPDRPRKGRDAEQLTERMLRHRGTGRRPACYKQVRLSADEMEASEESLRILRRIFGIPVQHSEIDRALWSLLRRAEESIEELERMAPKLIRPPTNDVQAKADMEDSIANFLLRAFKHYEA